MNDAQRERAIVQVKKKIEFFTIYLDVIDKERKQLQSTEIKNDYESKEVKAKMEQLLDEKIHVMQLLNSRRDEIGVLRQQRSASRRKNRKNSRA